MPNTMGSVPVQSMQPDMTITENLATTRKLTQEALIMAKDIVEKLDGPIPTEPSQDKMILSGGIIELSKENNVTMNELLNIMSGIRASL